MALVSPPWALQGGSHPAATVRQSVQGLLGSPFGSFAGGVLSTAGGGGHGIVGSADMAVTQNGTPNMSVNIAGGLAFIRGTESASQGCYPGYNDATVNVAIATSDPTNARIDLVVVKVRDSFYSGASADISFAVVTGTPSGSPAVPAVPANALVLAQVAVAATVTTILTANITDKRTRAYALGGHAACTSTTRPTGASLYNGLWIDETDTFRTLKYDGTGWVCMAEPMQSHTSTITSQTGTITTVGTTTFTYHRQDGWLEFHISVAITTTGTAGGSVIYTLPVNQSNTAAVFGAGREYLVGGKQLQLFSGSAGLGQFANYDNSYPGGNGYGLQGHGRYQMTTRYS